MPLWTAWMLGLGKLVWFFPAISAVLLLVALWPRAKLSLAIVTAVVVAVLVGMFYAVYPIHLMMSKNVV
jgi:hypothetical protein